MTQNKAKKTAARQRMAETGEPYSVARRAVAARQPGSSETGQILVRYHLGRTFELAIDPDVWAKADSKTRARLLAESEGAGSFHAGTTLAELIARDLDDRGTGAYTTSAAGKPGRDWEEEYYADGAASEGITVEEFKAREMAGRAEDWPPVGADEAQERADLAQERADQAQERAEEARELADEAQDLADEAREAIDEAREDGDRAAQARAEREAARAQERANRTLERAEQAQERAEEAQERADREQEWADHEQERADQEQERAGAVHGRVSYRLRGMPRPVRPPRPPRPPMPHQPPRPFR